MIPSEILKKVKTIEIRTRHLVDAAFSGEYRSVFKGKGIEFLEVREYTLGDDPRTIDWNVSARLGHLYVKKFSEERELNVIIVVDASESLNFGTRNYLKRGLAAEIGAVFAISAIRNNDKVGLFIFTDTPEHILIPRKGRKFVLRVVRDILYFEPKKRGTDPTNATEFLYHLLKRRSIIFFISDFLGKTYNENFVQSMSILSKKHDVISICLKDPFEEQKKFPAFINIEDKETGEIRVVHGNTLKKIFENVKRERQGLKEALTGRGVDWIDISTGIDYVPVLHKFFKKRARRMQ